MMDSNIIMVSKAGSDNIYKFEQVYKREQSPDHLEVENIGVWSPNTRLQDTRDTRVLARRRRNLMGMQLKTSMVVTNNDTLNHLDDLK